MSDRKAPRRAHAVSRPSLDRALDILDAVGRAGLALVPAKPTPSMVEKAARAGGVSEAAARKMYRTLLAAAE